MCGVCGCGQGEKHIEDLHHLHAHQSGDGHTHDYDHDHDHGHNHDHSLGHDREHIHTHVDGTTHSHPHSHAHEHDHAPNAATASASESTSASAGAARLVSVERDILARNDSVALQNRRDFQTAKAFVLNLVSSPGSGKTALLVETLKRIGGRYPIAVIEGDQETTTDADRIRATGAPAIQINTGKGCHLDAELVRTGMSRLGVPENGILFIENVGNLVCPAGFDLGEAHKVVIVSVTEGEDKPLKYSGMFAASGLMVVTKCDLLPHLDFDVERLMENARRVNPMIGVLKLSAKSGEGMDRWIHWLETARTLRLAAD
ncbi:MAG: hydrogenase nickel incorporation protein HypB [Rhodopila sp.]|jgi:hydrogenase nickel incorporation protein HypB